MARAPRDGAHGRRSPAAGAAASPAGRRAKTHRLLFAIHGWIGLKLSALLAVVLVSGTLAVFREEIDWLVYPQMRAAAGPPRAGLDAMRDAIVAAHPGVVFQAGFTTGADRIGVAAGVIGITPELGVRIFWFDRHRGIHTGSSPYFSPGFVLAHLHRQLMLPFGGEAIVTALSVLLAGSLISGLVVYKKFWRGFLRRPRRRDLRTLLGDLHRLIALWSLWFTTLMVLTGLWYFWILVAVPDLGAPAPYREAEPPRLSAGALPRAPAGATPIGIDAAMEIVLRHRPDFRIFYVDPPLTNRGVYAVHGNSGEVLAPYASVVFVNPYDGAVVGEAHAADTGPLARIDRAVTPLHYGTWGTPGTPWLLVSRTLWFAFGAFMSFLAVSGVVVFWRRTARHAGPPRHPILRALNPVGGTLGVMKLPTLALLLAAGGGAYASWSFMSTPTGGLSLRLAPRQAGDTVIAPLLNPGPGGAADVRAAGARPYVMIADFPALRRAYLSLAVARAADGGPAPGDAFVELSGSGGVGIARLPPGAGRAGDLELRLTGWDGAETTLRWPLAPQ